MIVCSEEAWEIITTLTRAASAASKTRRATPGTPAMPRPSMVTSAMPATELTVLTPWGRVGADSATRVPGRSGAKVLLIRIGIAAATAGPMVLGCSTRAPK